MEELVMKTQLIRIENGRKVVLAGDVAHSKVNDSTLLTLDGITPLLAKTIVKNNEEALRTRLFELEEKGVKTYDEFLELSMLKKHLDFGFDKPHISDLFDQTFFPRGIMDGELYVITGTSGGGKTAFCCMLTACSISGFNPYLTTSIFESRPVIYVSLEQPKDQIKGRIMSTLSALNNLDESVPYVDIFTGYYQSKSAMKTAFTLFSFFQKNLRVFDLSDFDSNRIEDILIKVNNEIENANSNPILIVDQYVNIANTSNPTNEEVIMAIKNFAREKNVPVFLQTQMSKEAVNSATDKNGEIQSHKFSGGSLRGTSGLEFQATAIFVITKSKQEKKVGNKTAYLTKISTVKNRMGANATHDFLFVAECNLFIDHEEKRGRPCKKNTD